MSITAETQVASTPIKPPDQRSPIDIMRGVISAKQNTQQPIPDGDFGTLVSTRGFLDAGQQKLLGDAMRREFEKAGKPAPTGSVAEIGKAYDAMLKEKAKAKNLAQNTRGVSPQEALQQIASTKEKALGPFSLETSTTATWQEIKDLWLQTPYSEMYAAAALQFQEWEKTPITPVNPDEWKNTVDQQIQKAEDLLNTQRSSARVLKTNKIVTQGKSIPRFGKEIATRMYLGLDPRKATDAYIALVDELEVNGSMKDIEAALNLEELISKKVYGHMVILYDPQSRPEVLQKMLEGYKTAKQKHPDLFQLSDRQKAKVGRENLRQFKATVDENLSFVEMPAEERGRSYDSGGISQTFEAFGIDKMKQYTDEEWLLMIKNHEALGRRKYVLTYQDENKRATGQIKKGDTVSYKRKLSSPALVQMGTFVI